jgi:hypothetical protein
MSLDSGRWHRLCTRAWQRVRQRAQCPQTHPELRHSAVKLKSIPPFIIRYVLLQEIAVRQFAHAHDEAGSSNTPSALNDDLFMFKTKEMTQTLE